jgi:outer membrane protein
MKHLQTIINVILIAAVATLFTLYITSNKNKNTPTTAKSPTNAKVQLIAYFNMDSLENQYEMAKALKIELKQKEVEAGNEVAKKQNERNLRMREIQEKASKIDPRNPNLSNNEIAILNDAQKQMQDIEMEFQQYKQDLGNRSSDYVRQKLTALKAAIEDYIKKYNSNNTYAYIFSSEEGINNMYYFKDKTYDITEDIVKGLNEEYKKKTKK